MSLDIAKVKHIMRRKNINQKDLADMCGVTEAAMSRYLSGNRQPKSEVLANMATALDTTSNDLLGLEEQAQADEVFRFVARNVSGISQDVKMKLIQLLSSSESEEKE